MERIALNTEWAVGCGAFKRNSILLVADEHNPADVYKDINQPFAGVLSPVSHWLNNQLEEFKIPENRLFWVNAYMWEGRAINLRALYDELRPSCVVALGSRAFKELEKQGVEIQYYQHHPQYWRRFRSKMQYPLLPLLQKLVALQDLVTVLETPSGS